MLRIREPPAASQASRVLGNVDWSAVYVCSSTGTEVFARLAGPSARLSGDHWERNAVRDVMRPIWLAA